MKAFIALCLLSVVAAESYWGGYGYGGRYGGWGGYRGYSRGYYGKRSADAEADPALVYSTAGYHYPSVYSGLYNHGVYNTHYTTPYVYGGIHHMGKREAEADPQYFYNSALTYSPYTYSSGLYNNFYGYRHFYKREAEAEADPALIYSGLHTPYTYGLNYNTYSAFPYTTAYTHHYGYGKREAEAEPWTVYGSPYTYGSYARPYSYGSYGNFYGGYRGWY